MLRWFVRRSTPLTGGFAPHRAIVRGVLPPCPTSALGPLSSTTTLLAPKKTKPLPPPLAPPTSPASAAIAAAELDVIKALLVVTALEKVQDKGRPLTDSEWDALASNAKQMQINTVSIRKRIGSFIHPKLEAMTDEWWAAFNTECRAADTKFTNAKAELEKLRAAADRMTIAKLRAFAVEFAQMTDFYEGNREFDKAVDVKEAARRFATIVNDVREKPPQGTSKQDTRSILIDAASATGKTLGSFAIPAWLTTEMGCPSLLLHLGFNGHLPLLDSERAFVREDDNGAATVVLQRLFVALECLVAWYAKAKNTPTAAVVDGRNLMKAPKFDIDAYTKQIVDKGFANIGELADACRDKLRELQTQHVSKGLPGELTVFAVIDEAQLFNAQGKPGAARAIQRELRGRLQIHYSGAASAVPLLVPVLTGINSKGKEKNFTYGQAEWCTELVRAGERGVAVLMENALVRGKRWSPAQLMCLSALISPHFRDPLKAHSGLPQDSIPYGDALEYLMAAARDSALPDHTPWYTAVQVDPATKIPLVSYKVAVEIWKIVARNHPGLGGIPPDFDVNEMVENRTWAQFESSAARYLAAMLAVVSLDAANAGFWSMESAPYTWFQSADGARITWISVRTPSNNGSCYFPSALRGSHAVAFGAGAQLHAEFRIPTVVGAMHAYRGLGEAPVDLIFVTRTGPTSVCIRLADAKHTTVPGRAFQESTVNEMRAKFRMVREFLAAKLQGSGVEIEFKPGLIVTNKTCTIAEWLPPNPADTADTVVVASPQTLTLLQPFSGALFGAAGVATAGPNS